MRHWSFSSKSNPELEFKRGIDDYIKDMRGIAIMLLTRYMEHNYRDREYEDVELEGVITDLDTGQKWEVKANGETVIEYEHYINNVSLQITTYPEPENHKDQKVMPGMEINREFHEALGLKAGGVR